MILPVGDSCLKPEHLMKNIRIVVSYQSLPHKKKAGGHGKKPPGIPLETAGVQGTSAQSARQEFEYITPSQPQTGI